MIDTGARSAPYGPPAAILKVISHYRSHEVPEKLSETTLIQVGIKDSLLRVVWRALAFLGLLRDDDTTTDDFRSLRFASDEEFPHVLGGIVQKAYADILSNYDPATAKRGDLMNAFRPYSPASQHERMVTLFLALCQAAGMAVADKPKESSVRTTDRPAIRTTPRKRASETAITPPIERHEATPRIDPLLKALFDKVPNSGEPWPNFERWLDALKATVKLTNPTAEG